MRHVFLILCVAIAGYAAWQMADKPERKLARRLITRHGLRLLALLLIVFLLVAAAVNFPSTAIL